MTRRMAVQRHRGDARKHLDAAGEAVHHVVIRRHLLSGALEIQFLRAFAGPRHRRVVLPVARLVLVHHQLGIGKQFCARLRIGQPGRVVRMHVRQDHASRSTAGSTPAAFRFCCSLPAVGSR